MIFFAVLGKLILVFVLAGAFGLNRQWAHKPIGFGTFIFVSIAACALAMLSVDVSGANPSPLLSAIVTGIGFLGAGAMIKTSDKIFGATTAASIWLFAIFGLLIGVGEFLLGLSLYVLVWVVLFTDKYLEKQGIGSYQRRVVIVTSLTVSEKSLRLILEKISRRYKFLELIVNKEDNTITRHYLIEASYDVISLLPKYLEREKGFLSCIIQ